MNLEKLIKEHDWYFVDSNLTSENFSTPKKLRKGKIVVFNPTTKNGIWTSEETLKEIKEKGLTPLNLYELLEWKKKGLMEKGKWYCAFGQLWKDADGDHRVPYVYRDSDGDFEFNLGYFEVDWGSDGCVVCFCDSKFSDPLEAKSDLNSLELLEKRVKDLEQWRERMSKWLGEADNIQT